MTLQFSNSCSGKIVTFPISCASASLTTVMHTLLVPELLKSTSKVTCGSGTDKRKEKKGKEEKREDTVDNKLIFQYKPPLFSAL